MKNLVYYSVGYDKKYNDLLEISIFSLKTHYDGDILIITDYENSIILKQIPIFNDIKFMIINVSNEFDSIINRMKIYDFYNIFEYDNVLYLDCDTIIIYNLDSIFSKTLSNNKFGICEDFKCIKDYNFNNLKKYENNKSLINGVFCFSVNIKNINIIKNIYTTTKNKNDLTNNMCYYLINEYFPLIECYLANYTNGYYCDNIFNINIIYNRNKYSIVHFINDFNTKINRMLNSYPNKIINNFQHLIKDNILL